MLQNKLTDQAVLETPSPAKASRTLALFNLLVYCVSPVSFCLALNPSIISLISSQLSCWDDDLALQGKAREGTVVAARCCCPTSISSPIILLGSKRVPDGPASLPTKQKAFIRRLSKEQREWSARLLLCDCGRIPEGSLWPAAGPCPGLTQAGACWDLDRAWHEEAVSSQRRNLKEKARQTLGHCHFWLKTMTARSQCDLPGQVFFWCFSICLEPVSDSCRVEKEKDKSWHLFYFFLV